MMPVLEVGWTELLALRMVEWVASPVRWAWQVLDALVQLGQRLMELGEAGPWWWIQHWPEWKVAAGSPIDVSVFMEVWRCRW